MGGSETRPAEYDPDEAYPGAPRPHLLVPVILGMLPLMIECASLINATVSLHRVAAEAGAAAASGAAPSVILAKIDARRSGIDGRFIDCRALCTRWGGSSGSRSGWSDLQMDGGGNDAAAGDRISVRLHDDHALVLGGLLAPLFGADADNTVELEAVERRVRQ